jgi:hypothetical protein
MLKLHETLSHALFQAFVLYRGFSQNNVFSQTYINLPLDGSFFVLFIVPVTGSQPPQPVRHELRQWTGVLSVRWVELR